MFVSIIVPIYNGEKYLDDCIQSIIEQSYNNFELILVNDGSKDSSLNICQRWKLKDSRVRICTKENGGVSSARNYGIKVCKGDYILFVDCDDILSQDYLLKMVEVVFKEGKYLLPVSAMQFIGDGAYFEFVEKDLSSLKKISDCVLEMYDRHLLNSPCNKLYNKSIILRHNIQFREDIDLGEDLLFNVAYLKTREIQNAYILEDIKYYYRAQNSVTLCSRYDKNYFRNQVEQFQEVFQLFHTLGADAKLSRLHENYDDMIRWSPHYYWDKAPRHKLKLANEILRKKEYKECLLRRRNTMHKLTWKIYNSGNFLLILLVEKLYAIIYKNAG